MVAAMDHLVPGQGVDFGALAGVLALAVGVYLASALAGIVQGYLLNDVVQGTVRRMRSDVQDKINALPLSYFDTQPRGELLSRVTNDIDNISQSLQQTMSQMLTSLLTVVGVLSMMVWISPTLALVAIATVPISMLVTSRIMKRSQGMFIQQWRRTGRLNAHIEESFTGHDLVKVFGRRAEVERALRGGERRAVHGLVRGAVRLRPDHAGDDVHREPQLRGHRRARRAPGRERVDEPGGGAGVHPVLAPVHPAAHPAGLDGQPAAVRRRLGRAGLRAAGRRGGAAGRGGARAGPGRLGSGVVRGRVVLLRPGAAPHRAPLPDRDPGADGRDRGPDGGRQDHAGEPGHAVLRPRRRTHHARRGRRGQRWPGPRCARRSAWCCRTPGCSRARCAPTSPTDGRTPARQEILEAAQATFVDRFVHTLPDGYDTVVDENGSNLSAGERQLVTIARAFLADPALLILDEATSSVDTRTELLLQEAMAALRTDRTSFVIAHRLSTIRDADVILVMEEGRIVEQGDHATLVAAGGAYAALYEAQFAAADPAV